MSQEKTPMPLFDSFGELEKKRRALEESREQERKAQKRRGAITLAFLVSLVGGIAAYFFADPLPQRWEIAPDILNAPVQEEEKKKTPFSFDYHGKTYSITPQARYEMAALVVSRNNISSLLDAYHDSRSVDTRDLCVMWGDNVKSDIFQKISVSNGSWTCSFSAKTTEDWNRFDPFQLSNNHLISDNEEIRKQIANIRIGDQIRLRGFLVDYSDESGFSRKTSLSRTDTDKTARGGGACEVFFVDSIEILRRGDHFFLGVSQVLLWLSGFFLLIKIIAPFFRKK